MNKKAQMQQVFIYILMIIVVGLILLIGYKAVGGLISKSCDVEQTTFKNTLESYITKYNSYGSYHKEIMSSPCGFAQICFVNTESIGNTISFDNNNIIKESVEGNIQKNIFLVKKEVTEPINFVPEIEVENEVICINNTNGKFYIAFEGLGKKTKILLGKN